MAPPVSIETLLDELRTAENDERLFAAFDDLMSRPTPTLEQLFEAMLLLRERGDGSLTRVVHRELRSKPDPLTATRYAAVAGAFREFRVAAQWTILAHSDKTLDDIQFLINMGESEEIQHKAYDLFASDAWQEIVEILDDLQKYAETER